MRLCGCVLLSVAAATATTLVDAAKQQDIATIRAVLAQHGDVNSAAPDGATALHWAAWHDHTDLAQLLLAAGAKPNVVNVFGVTPLALACTNGGVPLLKLLLEAGADPNTASPEGETPLMVAARTGNSEVVSLLLQHGASVDAKENWHGQTPLMWAAAEGHTGVVQQLIKAGADLNIRSKGGFDAYLFAVREGRKDTVRELLRAGANVNDVLPPRTPRRTGATELGSMQPGVSAVDLAVSNAHFELAAMLLDSGADPNHSGPGWTPLHTITWVRKPGTGSNAPSPPDSGTMTSLELVKKLAEKGADVNARMTRKTNAGLSALNMVGATPFSMAARTGDAELMRFLLNLGADPSITTKDGSTALMIAAGLGTRSPGEDAGTESEVLEAVRTALEAGNDPNAVDSNGETAMHGAAYKHLPTVAQYLASHGARPDVWNRKNKDGWTPLRIAAGVHRTGNLRASEPTAAAIRKIMTDGGVSTVLDEETVAAR